MRDLADRYCEGRWLAVGGGGYGLVRVVPRAWTHLIAAALDREIDPPPPIRTDWRERGRRARTRQSICRPTMGDGRRT